MTKSVILTTDGGFRRKLAVWAWVVQVPGQIRVVAHDVGCEQNSTSSRAELLAVINGLRWAMLNYPGASVTIVSDSAYVINCVNEGWWQKWIRNNWKSSKGTEVKNRDLWEQLIALLSPNLTFTHVKGHNGHPANELCDQLCTKALELGGVAWDHGIDVELQ